MSDLIWLTAADANDKILLQRAFADGGVAGGKAVVVKGVMNYRSNNACR